MRSAAPAWAWKVFVPVEIFLLSLSLHPAPEREKLDCIHLFMSVRTEIAILQHAADGPDNVNSFGGQRVWPAQIESIEFKLYRTKSNGKRASRRCALVRHRTVNVVNRTYWKIWNMNATGETEIWLDLREILRASTIYLSISHTDTTETLIFTKDAVYIFDSDPKAEQQKQATRK